MARLRAPVSAELTIRAASRVWRFDMIGASIGMAEAANSEKITSTTNSSTSVAPPWRRK
jgi:hypothetical protein